MEYTIANYKDFEQLYLHDAERNLLRLIMGTNK
ncbi:hypothetical protein QFZ80_003347 [Paenibacillus sp. V4I7]|nr:hypothetical protein [Paenibacillus sp. V4I7]